jgi:Leucine Rich repeat
VRILMAGGAEHWRAALDHALLEGEESFLVGLMPMGDVGAVELAEKFRRSGGKCRVKELRLRSCSIGDAGAHAIAGLLRPDNSDGDDVGVGIEVLDLSNNNIGSEGIAAVADGLRHNSTVRELWIPGNPGVENSEVEEEGIATLVSAIGVNAALKIVVVSLLAGTPGTSQAAVEAAMADTGRPLRHEEFQTGTKAARD